MEIYLYGSCSSCKKADNALRDSGKPYVRRDFFKERFSAAELRFLLERAGLEVGGVLSTRSKAYTERRLAGMSLTDTQLLDLMVDEPTLLRRPIIIGGGKSIVGFNAAAIDDLIGRT